ncbi:MAG: hypothetical protein H7Z72_13010 [Bacteroidetes bacterium]|nr:hypothetical protein [Fibrella sp.]
MIDSTQKFVRCLLLATVSAVLSLVMLPDCMLVISLLLSLVGAIYGSAILLNMPGSRGNFFLVAAETIVLGSSLGLLFSYVSMAYASYDIWLAVIDYTYTTATDLALAQAYTNLFALALFLIGVRLQQWGWPDRIQENVAYCLREKKATVIAFVILILVCQAYLVGAGVVVYGGRAITTEGEPTHPLLALLLPIAPVVPFVLAHYGHRAYKTGRFTQLLLCVLLLFIDLFWFFLFGRRTTIFFFIVLFTGFFFGHQLSVAYLLKHAVLILFIGYAALQAADTYHKVRIAYSFQEAQRMNLAEVFSGLSAVDTEKYQKLRNMNMAARASYSSMALGQFVNLFRTTKHEPLRGQVLLSSVLLATPGDLLVDKKTIPAKEVLYERTYSVGLTDISETLYLESFIDFGWLGFLLYPAFLFGLLGLIYYAAYRAEQPLFSLLVVCVSVSLALAMVETDMITFLATVRMLVVGCGLALVFGRRMKPEQVPGRANPALTVSP